MKVLVTGGGGFLGSHLVESQLARGHQVRTVDLHTTNLQHLSGADRLEIVRGDIADRALLADLLRDVDVVYHLASAHLDVSLPDSYYQRINVDATLELLRLAREAQVKRFVHCSSVGVFGDITDPPADEQHPCNPTNIYEKTKLAGEQAAVEFSARSGFPLVVARPAWIYGPRCPRTRKLIRAIRKGRFVIFGSGQTLRHPVYVEDAVRGLELCAETRAMQGQVYIIAGEQPVSIKTLVETIAQAAGVSAPKFHVPVVLGHIGGYGIEVTFKLIGKAPPFSRRSMDFFLKDNAYDITKARQELGFQPMVDLSTGFLRTLELSNEAEAINR